MKVPDMGDISTERSMEDILSSIKRIIAEEGDGAAQRAVRRPARASSRPVADPIIDDDDEELEDAVLELNDFADEGDDLEEPAPLPLREPRNQPEAHEEEPVKAASDEAIVSQRAVQATRGSLDALSRIVIKPEAPGADTLEGLVREMLRPMLSEWLDSNLPAIVETMVQREIERITKR